MAELRAALASAFAPLTAISAYPNVCMAYALKCTNLKMWYLVLSSGRR